MKELKQYTTEKELLGLLDTHTETVKIVNESTQNEEAFPVLLVHGYFDNAKGLQTTAIAMPNMSDSRKSLLEIGKMVHQKRKEIGLPVAISFSSEAWQAKVKDMKEFDKRMKKYGSISKFPKSYKEEVMIVSMLTAGRESAINTFTIKRDKKGKRTGLKMKMHKPKLDDKGESSLLDKFYQGWGIESMREAVE